MAADVGCARPFNKVQSQLALWVWQVGVLFFVEQRLFRWFLAIGCGKPADWINTEMKLSNRIIIGLLTCSPTLAQAQELGQITAFLNGEEHVWYTILMEQSGKSVATASIQKNNAQVAFYLQGHPTPHFTSKGMLSLDVRYRGQLDVASVPTKVEILYLPNGMAGPVWTSVGTTRAAEFQIVDFNLWGNTGEIIAAFSAELCATQITSGPVDLDDCIQLNGKIVSKVMAE